jgi:hypothetical protein
MTPHRSDPLCNVERSQAVVEIANGALIKAKLRGTARIKPHDINDANQLCDILVHDVPHVPGLSRRLLSVDQWMAAGGDIHFNLECATVRVDDSDTDEARSFDVPKQFPNLEMPSNAINAACSAVTPPKKSVPASLLHQRLGHRAINTMIVGSKNKVWADTALRLEANNFCDSCQIATACSANRGKLPLDVGTLDMQPGESVMVDLAPNNLNKHGLTTHSRFKHHVLVTDVKTRFAVPVGTNHKTPEDIARCLATWATDHGPDTRLIYTICRNFEVRCRRNMFFNQVCCHAARTPCPWCFCCPKTPRAKWNL